MSFSEFDVSGASVKIGSTELQGGATTGSTLRESVIRRELLTYSTYPFPKEVDVAEVVEGTIRFVLDAGSTPPRANVGTVQLTITLDGFRFVGNVRLTNVQIEAPAEQGSVVTGSFDFRTVDSNITWDNNPS